MILVFVLFVLYLNADNVSDNELNKGCLSCHEKERIPSRLIYKKYLLKYSSKDRIAKAMFEYIKNPSKEKSSLPKQFFLKFSLKNATNQENKYIKKQIRSYIDYYDMIKLLHL